MSVYAAPFSKEKPKIGVDLMTNKVKRTRQHDEDISDYIRDMYLTYDTFGKALAKQSRRVTAIGYSQFYPQLDTVLDQFHSDTSALSANCSQFIQTIARSVERVIREATNLHVDSSGIKLIESTCWKLLKDYEDKSLKIAKLQKSINKKKGNNDVEGKILEMSRSLEEVRGHLEEEMKRLYEQHERVDKSRLETIKKALITYHKAGIQQYQQNIQAMQSTLAQLESMDTSMDLQDFSSNYKALNLTLNPEKSTSLSSSVGSKVEMVGGFTSFFTRQRKNSGMAQSSMSSLGSDLRARSKDSLKMNDNTSKSSLEVNTMPTPKLDEEGYVIPQPTTPMGIDATLQDNEDHSDTDSSSMLGLATPVMKFDIQAEAIVDDPMDAAKAVNAISLSLRKPSSYQTRTRGRRAPLDSTLVPVPEARPLSELNSPTVHKSPMVMPLQPRPFSAHLPANINDEEMDDVTKYQGLRLVRNEYVTCHYQSNETTIQTIVGKIILHIDDTFEPNDSQLQIQVQSDWSIQSHPNLIYHDESNNYYLNQSNLIDRKGQSVDLIHYKIDSKQNNQLPFDIKQLYQQHITDDKLLHHLVLSILPNTKTQLKTIQFGFNPNQYEEIMTYPKPKVLKNNKGLIYESEKGNLTLALKCTTESQLKAKASIEVEDKELINGFTTLIKKQFKLIWSLQESKTE